MSANASYIDTFERRDPLESSTPFLWTMIAMAALDLLLLFWMFNPISGFHKQSFQFSPATNVEDAMLADDGAKPSPLGSLRKAENHRYMAASLPAK